MVGLAGKKVGGMLFTSAAVFREDRIIQMKGNTMMKAPMVSSR